MSKTSYLDQFGSSTVRNYVFPKHLRRNVKRLPMNTTMENRQLVRLLRTSRKLLSQFRQIDAFAYCETLKRLRTVMKNKRPGKTRGKQSSFTIMAQNGSGESDTDLLTQESVNWYPVSERVCCCSMTMFRASCGM